MFWNVFRNVNLAHVNTANVFKLFPSSSPEPCCIEVVKSENQMQV